MVTVKVTRKGPVAYIQGMPLPHPMSPELIELFGDKDELYFEASVNHGIVTLVRTVPAPC